ncbi:MAG: alpha-amylase, partial [Thermoplasmata archaeon]
LSSDSRVSIFIEDHYYNRTDAAVVFKFHDKRDGRVRYIYHGNDGTRMPWNDTAQFNYLKPEVREAMIQTVLYVAKKFPIIRFDAAMTLTKMHYARLWFPEPGHGGDIPSRAGHGMTKEEFNRVMPEEFWRTVVDRVAKEAPDTLLLAEAFWLLEGYFVRTLGMHRVYNSAFMNMLRDEKNAEYRAVIKNTIEFDPEILKRYVNFLNNPDEETAVAQFGKGDKYFGITIMMCTLPGLPMFGHGQIEGFTEKYGMEYKRAYYDEKPDLWLVSRHEKEVFPLIRKRYLFAESANFRLYDLFTESGSVDENVFAYSNRRGEEKALVLYNNHFGTSRGWIRISAAYAVKSVAHGEGNSSEETPLEKRLVQETLADALRLHDAPGWFVIMKDMISSQEYIFESRSLCSKGMWVELEGYKCRVFMEIREVVDDEEHYISRLCYSLQGRGVKNIEHAIKMMKLEKVHRTFRDLFNLGMKGWIRRCIYEYCEHVLSGGSVDREGEVRKEIADANIADAMNAVHEANKNFNKMREEIGWKLTALVQEIKHFSRIECNSEKAVGKVLSGIDGLVHLLACMRIEEKDPEYIKELKTGLNSGLKQEPERFYALIDFILLKSMESAFIESLSSLPDNNMDAELLLHQTETQSKKETSVDLRESYKKTRELIDAMELGRILEEEYRAEPYMREKGVKYLHLFKWLIPEHRILMDSDKTYREKIETLLLNEDFRSFVNVNFYNGILWFSKEIFEEAMFFLQATSCIQICSAILQPADAVPERTSEYKEIVYKKAEVVWRDIKSILTAAEKSGYKLDALLGNLENHNSNSRTPEDEIKKN